jgi:hypothetical protein
MEDRTDAEARPVFDERIGRRWRFATPTEKEQLVKGYFNARDIYSLTQIQQFILLEMGACLDVVIAWANHPDKLPPLVTRIRKLHEENEQLAEFTKILACDVPGRTVQ